MDSRIAEKLPLPREMLQRPISPSAVVACAVAIESFVLGFAYGNVMGLERTFELQQWQTFVGSGVAIGIGLLAFFGVIRTQRITVMIKEQDRLEARLPGLRQAMMCCSCCYAIWVS
jgi:hypothetical protein